MFVPLICSIQGAAPQQNKGLCHCCHGNEALLYVSGFHVFYCESRQDVQDCLYREFLSSAVTRPLGQNQDVLQNHEEEQEWSGGTEPVNAGGLKGAAQPQGTLLTSIHETAQTESCYHSSPSSAYYFIRLFLFSVSFTAFSVMDLVLHLPPLVVMV